MYLLHSIFFDKNVLFTWQSIRLKNWYTGRRYEMKHEILKREQKGLIGVFLHERSWSLGATLSPRTMGERTRFGQKSFTYKIQTKGHVHDSNKSSCARYEQKPCMCIIRSKAVYVHYSIKRRFMCMIWPKVHMHKSNKSSCAQFEQKFICTILTKVVYVHDSNKRWCSRFEQK
jgi:hypothetical protein